MSDEEWDLRRSCKRKKHYRRKGDARSAASRFGSQHVYSCEHCSGYHLSSKRLKKQAVELRVKAGDLIEIEIVELGRERGQGVGYLDGSMVVVLDGAPYVGKTVTVLVLRVHETSVGWMVFGEMKREGEE